MDQPLCKHEMNPEWCAECKGLKTPEEEELEIFNQEFYANLANLGNLKDGK